MVGWEPPVRITANWLTAEVRAALTKAAPMTTLREELQRVLQHLREWGSLDGKHMAALSEVLLADIAELNTKLDAIKTAMDALKAEIATLKNQPPPVATQADLDALAAKEDAILNG